jgi:dimeric dUTPase (all-alpha-NTP-PPase superfamily)
MVLRGKVMKFSELLEIQRNLEERIEKEHPKQPGEDRVAKKHISLFVELGELANEIRFFKYWSHDQEPRTKHYVFEHGIKLDPVTNPVNPVLEEAADVLHCLLLIALDLKIKGPRLGMFKKMSLEEQFLDLFDQARSCYVSHYWHWTWSLFLGLIEMLGFTWDELCEAYLTKNAENIRRQEVGY